MEAPPSEPTLPVAVAGLRRSESFDALVPDDLICSVCLSLLYEPVIWPGNDDAMQCDHTFCKKCATACVLRQLEPCCPLCRLPARADAATAELPVDSKTVQRLETEVPEQHAARIAQVTRDVRLREQLPQLMVYALDAQYSIPPGVSTTATQTLD